MLYTDYLDNFVQRNTLNPDQIDGSNISDKIAAGTITMSETAFSYIQNYVTPSGYSAELNLFLDHDPDIVPTGLAVLSTSISVSSTGAISAVVNLSWDEITTGKFSYYQIRHRKTGNTYYTYSTSKSNTFSIDGLLPNTSYDFGVASVNKNGVSSAFSTNVVQVTAKNTTPPATVTGASAAGGIQYVILEWTANSEADINGYDIYRNTVDNSSTATLIANSKSTYFVDGDKVGGQEYFYWLKATNTSGEASESFSGVVSATPRNVSSTDNQISNIGWVQDCIFSSTNNTTVAWTAGTFKTSAGNTYNILTGNTGVMAARTYIYLDIVASTTEYQTTTTATNAVGDNKVLIGVAQNVTDVTKHATFQIFGGGGGQSSIVDTVNIALDAIEGSVIAAGAITETKIGDDAISTRTIAANAITASKIAAGTITTTEIKAGTIAASNIAANTITANEIASATITTNEIASNTIVAGNIKAGTVTATEIDTASITSLSNLIVAADKILIDGTTYLSNWRNSTDVTKIDGGNIYTGTVTATQLSFTPTDSSNVIGIINASSEAEGIRISAARVNIDGNTNFSSGYDPTGRVLAVGGTYDSAASGARVRVFPDANTGLQVIDNAGNDVFKTIIGGTHVGDVYIGDYSGSQGMWYDKSASKFYFRGVITADDITAGTLSVDRISTKSINGTKIADSTLGADKMNVSQLSAISADIGSITSGTITGATIQTSSSSYAGIKMSSSLGGLVSYGESIEIRDTSNTLYGTIGGYSGYFNIYSSGNRNMRLSAGSGKIYCNSDFGPIDGITGALLGFASQPWNTIYGGNLVSNNLYAVGSASYIRYFSSAWNISSDTKVAGSIYATGAIECQTARIKVGSYDFYPTTGAYDSSKYYLRS